MSDLINKKLANIDTALVSYIVAGDPDIETSYKIAENLIKSGTDILELGMPFSDPVADGPTIQAASKRALANKVNLGDVFSLAKKINKNYPDTPIILMGYFNPIHKMGVKNFLKNCKKANISGLIIVDLPYEEIINYPELKNSEIPLINLITGLSDEERIKKISKISKSFLYYISVFGITGTKEPDLKEITKKLKSLKKQTNKKLAVGFGIKSEKQIKTLKENADLLVIGSKYCQIIEKNLKSKTKILSELKKFNSSLSKIL